MKVAYNIWRVSQMVDWAHQDLLAFLPLISEDTRCHLCSMMFYSTLTTSNLKDKVRENSGPCCGREDSSQLCHAREGGVESEILLRLAGRHSNLYS